MEKERNSSLELLRIICMFLIIMHHYSYHGGFDEVTYENLSVSMIFIQILSFFGKIPCQLYALITGYFLITSNAKNYYKKILKIVFTLLFYSIGILLISFIFNLKELALIDVVKSFLSIFYDSWYVINYVLLLLLVPSLNKILVKLDKESFKKLVLFVIIIWSVIPTIVNCFRLESTTWTYGNLDFFIVMYFIGAYIRLYYKNKWSNIYNLLLSLSFIIILIGLTVLLDYISYVTEFNVIIENASDFWQINSIITLIISVSMFIYFANIKIKSKFINAIASTTLGIYIIHENYLMRRYIWKVILPNINYVSFPYVHFIVKVIVLFVLFAIIEYLRKKIIADKLDDLVIEKISLLYNKIFNKNVKLTGK